MVMQLNQLLVVESRIGVLAAVPGTGIHDVPDIRSAVFGQALAAVQVVGLELIVYFQVVVQTG